MRRRFALLFAATAVAALTVAGTGVAQSATRTYGRVVPIVKAGNGGTTAVVRAVYSCNQSDHLWVSAKQVYSGQKDSNLTLDGSASYADTWVQSHRDPIICDGRTHLGSFPIDEVEDGSKGALVPGWAWVQFCNLYGSNLTISEALWVRIV